MATYDAPLDPDAFHRMEQRRQTILPLVARPEHAHVCSGDRIEFGNYGSVTAGMVRRYPDLEALVAAQGWHCIAPEAEDADQAIEALRQAAVWDEQAERSFGVVAVRVRAAQRKH